MVKHTPLDPRAEPGSSLTSTPGEAAWETPPTNIEPDKILSNLWKQLTKPKNAEKMLSLLGTKRITAKELVQTNLMALFVNGEANPDGIMAIGQAHLAQVVALAERYKKNNPGFSYKIGPEKNKKHEDEMIQIAMLGNKPPKKKIEEDIPEVTKSGGLMSPRMG